jgi:ABC-type Fe3+ transport system permease subunit
LAQLKNLTGLWDHRTLGLLGAGLKLSAWVTGGALLLASLLLLLLGFTPSSRLRWLVLIGIGLTFCIPPVVHLSAWQGLTLKAGFPPLLNATVVLTWSTFPLAVGLLLLGLLHFNPASLEAGLLYGEPYGISRYLLLPPLLPSLFTAVVLIFLLTFIQSEVPSLVGYPVYADEFLARLVLEPNAAAAIGLALPQFVAVLVTVPLLLRLEQGLLAHSWQTGGLRRLATLWPTYQAISWVTFGFLGVLLIPFLSLLARARFTGLIATHGVALTTSLTLGLLSTVLAVMLAHLSADALVTVNAAWRAVLLTLVLLQFLLPGPLLALGMLKLANGLPWLKQGDVLLILTHALRVFPLLALLLAGWRAPRAGAHRNEVELLGIAWWRRQWRLRLPQERSPLGFAAGLGLALVLAELPTTVLVVAPGTETAVLRLYNLMHYGDWAGVAALAVIEALLVSGSLLLAGVIVGKWHAHR